MADVTKAHLVVGFCMLATGDVEMESFVSRFRPSISSAIVRPKIIELDEARHRGFAILRGKGLALASRCFPDRSVEDGVGHFLSQRLDHLSVGSAQ
jgi:hypothetical protein